MAEDEEYSKEMIEGIRLEAVDNYSSTKTKPRNGGTNQ
jgi:hypothetical protein